MCTLLLIILNVLVFTYQNALTVEQHEQFLLRWSAVPVEVAESMDLPPTVPFPIVGTVVSALFLHANLLHLALNMGLLALFGIAIERRGGAWSVLLLFFAGGSIGNLVQIAITPHTLASLVGASGAIAALIGALIIWPRTTYHAYAIVVWSTMQLAALFDAFSNVRWISGGLAIWSHVGGLLTGMTIAVILQRAGVLMVIDSTVQTNASAHQD